ncbi:MAG: hypothetical protein CM1200mP18_03820 [Gammaproteobacteria bacterium]|nr:MAG: hypothetical protein CM1200mP18_03820 [Gammaproteobacteria bacterium]
MARVRDIDINEVPADVRPIYERFSKEYGPFPNQVKVFAHRPPAFKKHYGATVGSGPTKTFCPSAT